ncbi:MAG: dihydrolipoyl dehydrogenase [Deltaproteobacteria bacterium]|nr:dihydrolipoyl dehydrogenase [Deltaproteobacteria bacterium]
MPKRIAVIGAGPGGYVAAIRAAQLSAEVTLIEKENVGGTCLNRGCVPSKIMKTSAELMNSYKRAADFGLVADETLRVDMDRLMAQKRFVIESQSNHILKLLAGNKVRYLKGSGRITAQGQITVDLEDGSSEAVIWDSLVLALGTKPACLPNAPMDGHKIISSNEALELKTVPESILIVGGGVVGCEFAFILSSLGSRVTVVEALSRLLPLPSVDEDCSKIIRREMKKRRIELLLNRSVERIEEVDSNLRITVGPSPWAKGQKPKDLSPVIIESQKVLVCIGRQPNTGGLGLEETGIALNKQGWIMADERTTTTVPNVYAVGDVLGPQRIMLAHVASVEGMAAVENIMGRRKIVDYSAVPTGIFTMPEVACVGMTERTVREQKLNYRADSVNFRNVSKAQVIGEIAGQAKIISDADTGLVLGMHIIGPHATDLIAEATIAVRTGYTIRDLAETVHAHPTLAEIVLETSYKGLDRPIHG